MQIRYINWEHCLGKKEKSVLKHLGYYNFPNSFNIVCNALKNKQIAQELLEKFTLTTLARVASLNQMVIYDEVGGPDEDFEPKGLRRHWYAWFKVDFAIPLSEAKGEDLNDTKWGPKWSGLLSTTYGYFVDNFDITYRDMWVKDASRMMERIYESLFQDCYIIVAVEKDSLLEDFVPAARALGAASVYSGKGKSSKAGIEKLLREHFGWSEDWNRFSIDSPLYVIHISDWDYDGEQVIGNTFGEQCKRYTPWVTEARIGVNPEQLEPAGEVITDKMYKVKKSNSAYEEWCEFKGIMMADCSSCGTQYPVVGMDCYWSCPNCGSSDRFVNSLNIYGLEVESMKTRAYYSLIVEALLSVMDFDYIIKRLREECTASASTAADLIQRDILEDNESYQRLMDEFGRLERIKEEFEERIRQQLYNLAEPHVSDWEDEEDNPEAEDFIAHVENARSYSSPWRPFSRELRTNLLVNFIRENNADNIEDLTNEEVEF